MLKKYKLLIIILIFAFIIRFWNIGMAPSSLNWDEVSHGFNAYSILKTGKDEWGNMFPLIFRAYGDYKLPVYIYLTAVSEFLFGISVFSIRLPSILAGTSLVFATFLLVKRLFKDNALALMSALLVSLSPWSLFLSRAALEANVAVALIAWGVYFLLKGIEGKRYSLLVAITLLGLSVWTYNSARIFAPLLIAAVTLIYRSEFLKIFKSNKIVTSSFLFLAALFFIPMFFQLLNPEGLARFGKVKILDDGAIARIIEERNNSTLPSSLARLVHNKATFFSASFVKNYVNHFSINFLFTKGGDNYQFSVPENGLLYLLNLPMFLLGLWALFKSKNRKGAFVILAWISIAPIASSLTREAPHVLRSIVFLPIPMIISALGVFYLVDKINIGKIILFVYLILLFISFGDYYNDYLNGYRSKYSWSWQYGYSQAIDVAKSNYDKYEKIVVSKIYGEPHEFFLLYWPWDPKKYQEDPNLVRFEKSNWFWVDKFDKFYFVNDWQIPKVGSRFILESGQEFDCASCLLITSPGNAPENWDKLETISFLDGRAAFEIYEH